MATTLTTTGVARVLQRTAAPRSVEQGRSGRRCELLDHDCMSPATSAGAAGQDPWKDGPPRGKKSEKKKNPVLPIYIYFSSVLTGRGGGEGVFLILHVMIDH